MEQTPPLPARCAPPRGWGIRVRFGDSRGCGSDYLINVILGQSRFLLAMPAVALPADAVYPVHTQLELPEEAKSAFLDGSPDS